MKTSLILVFITTALAAASAQAMGSGHNPLQSAVDMRAAPIDSAAAGPRSCRAVPLAGTQQRSGGARGSCFVVEYTADKVVGSAGATHTRTQMQGGRSVQSVRVAATR